MFRRDHKAGFIREGFFSKKWRFVSGNIRLLEPMNDASYKELLARQQHVPMAVMHEAASRKRWWVFRGDTYLEDEGLSADDVRVLILDRAEQSQRKVRRATARLAVTSERGSTARVPIPDHIKTFVWQRDGGRCVRCRSQVRLEFDHIISLSMNGSNSARNIQLLCEGCNREKGGNLL